MTQNVLPDSYLNRSKQFATKAGWNQNVISFQKNGLYILPPGVSLNGAAHTLIDFLGTVLGKFGIGEFVSVIPNELLPKPVKIKMLGITVKQGVIDVSLTLMWENKWDLGFIAITAPHLQIEYQNGYVGAVVSGVVNFGHSFDLAIEMELPSGILKGQMPSGSSATAAQAMTKYNLPSLPTSTTHGPYLSSFKMIADIRDKNFLGHIGVTDITLRSKAISPTTKNGQSKNIVLKIADLEGDIAYSHSAQGQATGSLLAQFVIGYENKPIVPTVQLERLPKGWQVDGSITGQKGKGISLNDFIDDLLALFGIHSVSAPNALKNLIIESLTVSYNSETKDFAFFIDVKFPKTGTADLKFKVDFTHTGADNYIHTFSGSLIIAKQEFDVVFSQQTAETKTSTFFIADYQNLGGTKLKLGNLLHDLGGSTEAQTLGNHFDINLKTALIGYANTTKATHIVLAADLGLGIDLSNLPLVNQLAPKNQALTVQFRPVFATNSPVSHATVAALNALVPSGAITLPNKPAVASPSKKGGLEHPFALAIKLKIGGETFDLDVALGKARDDASQKLGISANKRIPAVSVAPQISLMAETPNSLEQKVNKLDASEDSPDAIKDEAMNLKRAVDKLEVVADVNAAAQPAVTPDTPLKDPDSVTWYDVQKSLGPVHFQRVGVSYKAGKLHFLLEVSLSAVGLSFELNGLEASIPLTDVTQGKLNPTFSLHGLGLDFKKGNLEIGGEFLHNKIRILGLNNSLETAESYDGMLRVQFESLTLAAIGSYARIQGHHSVFVYLTVDYPLGGPSFFFVTGLAAGFGYNRDFISPKIDGVLDFPLVTEAIQSPAPALEADSQNRFDRLNQEVGKLQAFIPPKIGQYFLAAGIKYTSFEMIDSFTMLAIAFGRRLEIDLLGISSAVMPTPEPGGSATTSPLAEIQIALKARFVPADGILTVEARLTRNSYIFSRKCVLTGGLAFYAWFKDQTNSPAKAGDFAFTVGGYHKKFNPPAYYPRVPQLGFSWQVSDLISVKGNAYFALTPNAMMAGGHLEALWRSGPMSAWFKAGADFLLGWKPFHYDAQIYVSIGASLVFHFFGTHYVTVELGGDLHLWGPEFSGRVKIHYYIVSVTVEFGGGKSQAKPISWDQFRQSFLPKGESWSSTHQQNAKGKLPKNICSAAVSRGMVKTVKEGTKKDERWIINAKDFKLSVESVIPVSKISGITSKDKALGLSKFGIAPMGIKDVVSTMTITIKRGITPCNTNFRVKPIKKGMPAALWGDHFDPDINGQRMVDSLCTGFEITPQASIKPHKTTLIDKAKLNFEPVLAPTKAKLIEKTPAMKDLAHTRNPQQMINQSIQSAVVVKQRNAILEELGFRNPLSSIDVTADLVDQLIITTT